MCQEFWGVGAKSATEVGHNQTGSDPKTGGCGELGQATFSCCFPLCRGLTWQANVSKVRFSSLFPAGFLWFSSATCSDRWQEIFLVGPQMFLGTVVTLWKELSSECAGGHGDCCCPGWISVKHIGCIVGSILLEDGVSRLFTLTVSALNYSQDCINICQEYSSSSFGGLISAHLRNGHVWDVWAHRRRQFQLDYLPLKQFYFNNRVALWENKQLYMKNVSSFMLYSGLTFPAFLFRQVCF